MICSAISAAAAWFRWDGAYNVMTLFARFCSHNVVYCEIYIMYCVIYD